MTHGTAASSVRQRVAIVGGGIAGLSVAHALLKQGAAARGIDVTVLERSPRPGGIPRGRCPSS